MAFRLKTAPAPSFATLPRLDPSPRTVLDHLETRFPHVGREVWTARMSQGLVTFDDGETVGPTAPYRPGARIRYFRAVEREPEILHAEEILHQDDTLLVADKPPFLPVTPSGPYVNECLLYRLRRRTGLPELTALHRLDRDTSGLVLFATDASSRKLYARLFQERRIEKEYLALAPVGAAPMNRSWEIENRIERGEPWFRMRIVAGQPNATTRVELLDIRDGIGLFRLRPGTGKKHQLRLHLASLGYPILNDPYYPDLLPEASRDPTRPLALLASRLGFADPVTGHIRSFVTRRQPCTANLLFSNTYQSSPL